VKDKKPRACDDDGKNKGKHKGCSKDGKELEGSDSQWRQWEREGGEKCEDMH